MKTPFVVAVIVFLAVSGLAAAGPHHVQTDPCDAYGDCLSSSITYVRSNPDDSLYTGDQFTVSLTYILGAGSSSSASWSASLTGIAWAYDESAFRANASGTAGTFIVVANFTGSYTVSATATFLVTTTVCATSSSGTVCTSSQMQSQLTVSEQVGLRAFILDFNTTLVNATDTQGRLLRNPDGSFYRNDSFCVSWNATFKFSSVRTDIKINVTSTAPPPLRVLNYSSDPLGRTGRFCYVVSADSPYKPFAATLTAKALNWQRASIGLEESEEPFAVVQYDPLFTSYSYMLFANSTASSSLQRPWVLLVRYDGNLPGYSYAGGENTHPFNGIRTLAQRAFFSDFRYSTLSYKPYTSGGVLEFHMTNSSGTIEYDWLNEQDSKPMYYGMRIEKYVFNVTASSLTPLLSEGYVFQNVTMIGCWGHESECDLAQGYWLVPFLWNGRLNIVSVDSNGSSVPGIPINLTIHNPAPLDGWLTSGFEHVFGNDSQAIAAFESDLYPTSQTMSFSDSGSLSVLLNQTSLSPPMISITAGTVSLGGNFTFVPTFVNSAIASIPNSLNGTVYYANATIPMWAYNMVPGSLAYLPVATAIDYPSSFLELVNSSVWVAGNTTAPQTPSAFASQEYGFWPLGEDLTLYVNTQGGGVELLGTQKLGPNEYQASFYIEPWSGGISSIQLVEGNVTLVPQPTTGGSPYQSPLPPSVTGFYSVTYAATGQDVMAVFTNIWGATTTMDLGTPTAPAPLVNLIPATTVAAFGVAFLIWLVVSGILRTRKTEVHE